MRDEGELRNGDVHISQEPECCTCTSNPECICATCWMEQALTGSRGSERRRAMFAQTGDGGDKSWKLRQNCYKCRERGHIARGCPLNEEKQDQMHTTINEEIDVDKEDTNDRENIFVQKKE